MKDGSITELELDLDQFISLSDLLISFKKFYNEMIFKKSIVDQWIQIKGNIYLNKFHEIRKKEIM